jgi:fluoroquinolone resistance protein
VQADLEGCDLRGCDLTQAATAGARLARADLRHGQLHGLDLTALASRDSLKVSLDQAAQLLDVLGVDVHVI